MEWSEALKDDAAEGLAETVTPEESPRAGRRWSL